MNGEDQNQGVMERRKPFKIAYCFSRGIPARHCVVYQLFLFDPEQTVSAAAWQAISKAPGDLARKYHGERVLFSDQNTILGDEQMTIGLLILLHERQVPENPTSINGQKVSAIKPDLYISNTWDYFVSKEACECRRQELLDEVVQATPYHVGESSVDVVYYAKFVRKT